MEENKTFWKRLVRSADTVTTWAFSARKLTAFAIIACMLVGHGIYYKHCYAKEDFALYDTVLVIDYVAAGFFLGLVTAEQILQFRNKKKEENATQTPTNPTNGGDTV